MHKSLIRKSADMRALAEESLKSNKKLVVVITLYDWRCARRSNRIKSNQLIYEMNPYHSVRETPA